MTIIDHPTAAVGESLDEALLELLALAHKVATRPDSPLTQITPHDVFRDGPTGAVVFEEDDPTPFVYDDPSEPHDPLAGFALPTYCGVAEKEDGRFEIAAGIGNFMGATAATTNDLLAFGLAALRVAADKLLPGGRIPARAVAENRFPVERLDLLREAYSAGFRHGWDEVTSASSAPPVSRCDQDGLRGEQLDAAAEWGYHAGRAAAATDGDGTGDPLVRALNHDRNQLISIVRDHRPIGAPSREDLHMTE